VTSRGVTSFADVITKMIDDVTLARAPASMCVRACVSEWVSWPS